MGLLDLFHARAVYGRRVEQLANHLAALLPQGATVLDVGCGDGRIDRMILDRRPDLSVSGIDVLLRPDAKIPVRLFDGFVIPAGTGTVDVVMFIDVLHHTADPTVLLGEAARVARMAVVIKDHVADGLLSVPLLRFMDWVGNARHGVALPYNYWSSERWSQALAALGLHTEASVRDLHLYPPGLEQVFGDGLHFIARLAKAPTGSLSESA